MERLDSGIRRPCYVSVAYSHEPTDPRVRRHCETMARRGWRVYQLGLATDGECRTGHLNGVVLVRRRRPRYRGGKLLRYLTSYVGFFLWALRLVARLARARTVDVVHANNIPNFVVFCAAPARRRGAGVILDIHDPVPELFLSKFGRRRGAAVLSGLLRLEERVAARYAHAVLCVHDVHREVTEAHGVDSRKIRVVINAPDAHLFPLGSPRRPHPLVAYHGTVAGRMALDTVLEALHLLLEQGVPVRGAIWGDGDAVEHLKQVRERLGMIDVVDLPGRRFRLESLVPKLGTVGVGIVPIARDVFTDVGLPTKLLEYVRLGIPVVAAWNPTVDRYFPEDTVRFVREFTAEAVAAALVETLRCPDESRERAARAQRLPIAASWQDLEGAFAEIVEGVRRA